MSRDPRFLQYKHCLIFGSRSVPMTKANSLRRGYEIRPRYHRANETISHGMFFGPRSFAPFYKGDNTPPSFNWKPSADVPFISMSYAHYSGSR